jgi:DNA-directed RNA polymerase specialized sigma24 family protein
MEPALVTGESAGDLLAGLFSQHYVALVRLAVVLVRDLTAAEEVVQDAFVAMHGRRRLRQDPDQALAYLRRAVVIGSRSVLRHRTAPKHPADPVAAALAALPGRQCEAVILRYYADLSEQETAAAMGISQGAVRSHARRGMAALYRRLHG